MKDFNRLWSDPGTGATCPKSVLYKCFQDKDQFVLPARDAHLSQVEFL